MTVNTGPKDLTTLSQAERMLPEAQGLDEIKDMRDKAQTAQAYAKKTGLCRDIILRAAFIKADAERRRRQLLATLPSAKNPPFRNHSQRSWIEFDRNGHSNKPEEIRTLIEVVSHPPYLERYARFMPSNSRWTVYGNQAISIKEQDRSSEGNAYSFAVRRQRLVLFHHPFHRGDHHALH